MMTAVMIVSMIMMMVMWCRERVLDLVAG